MHPLPLLRALTLAVFLSIVGFPGIALAQTAATTDGSNDSPTQRSQYIRGWRGQSSDMQQKIQALGTTISTSVPIPVLFGVELTNLRSDFGDARSNGRTHIGNDIMAVKGTPIVSPTPAVVLRIGVGSGEGNYVYTANPGGETFVYMHLDKFGEGLTQGTVLEKGSLIGYVGNTGNASGGAAHLHFEIHDSNGTAMNPYGRINTTLTVQEKMQYVTKIFSINTDQNTFASLLATNFRSTFNQATALNIAFPELIKNYLTSLPVTSPATGTSLPAGDLELGSKGIDVIKLQQYLIARNTGPYALRLSQAGATGNFGAMTQSALIEYQLSVGISPADGYYGSQTRLKVDSTPVTSPATPVTPTPTIPAPTGSVSFSRDLTLNSVGEDVRVLQRFLNTHGYTVAVTDAGSFGSETTYFGPATRAAVIRFQIAKGITPAAGYVGQITRRMIASIGI